MRLDPFLDQLQRVLPPRWSVELSTVEPPRGGRAADAVISLGGPDGSEATLSVEAKPRISARQTATIISTFASRGGGRTEGIVFGRFVSRMARERLRDAGVSYLDRTGNAWISITRPAVFIEMQGADADPEPERRGVRSLKGAKAARIVRGLCDWPPPIGVRELARRTGTNPGYVTRVLSLLDEEDIVIRGGRGEVVKVRWQDLLRRWSMDYSVAESNRVVQYLAPRGTSWLRERLASFGEPYALTGPFAVPPEALVAPGRLLSCYVTSADMAAQELDVRPTESGANVLLLEPFDEVIFARTRNLDGLTTVALSQCVIDLMTGSGRDPAQAAALMSWMAENEDAWRP